MGGWNVVTAMRSPVNLDVMLVSLARRKGNRLQRVVVDTPYFHGFPTTRRQKASSAVVRPSGAVVRTKTVVKSKFSSKNNGTPRDQIQRKIKNDQLEASISLGPHSRNPNSPR